MKLVIISIILQVCYTREVHELQFTCPHAQSNVKNYAYASVDLSPVDISTGNTDNIESSCPFEFHTLRKAPTTFDLLTWDPKESNNHETKASENSFQTSARSIKLTGTCYFVENNLFGSYESKNAFSCIEYSCNHTLCIPTLHVIVPRGVCHTVRSCMISWGQQHVNLHFEPTFCPHGLLTGGNCFLPLLGTTPPSVSIDYTELDVTCFLTKSNLRGDLGGLMHLVNALEQAVQARTCSSEFPAFYTCIIGGFSTLIIIPQAKNPISELLLEQIVKSPYGEDHDKLGMGVNSLSVVGEKDIQLHTNTAGSVRAQCTKGNIIYTSLYQYVERVGATRPLIVGQGIIPLVNYSICEKKTIPLVWKGYITIPGHVEPMEKCNIFCTLAGPGASCEAFSRTGIFNISSPTCLVGRIHRYTNVQDQITFMCERVDNDIVVTCNGQTTTIKTATLVVGQCIYVVTSTFSLLPSVAHSIAIEVCVRGFHGWASIALLVTFCFGWLIIPAVTYIVLKLLKYTLLLLNKHSGESRLKTLMRKIQDEFQKTLGSTVCPYCETECVSKEELDAHNDLCSKGSCPYCMKDIGLSKVVAQEHYKGCPLSDRFKRKIKEVVHQPERPSIVYRRVITFRYRNRCYIMMVWILLLLVEALLWAVSAQSDEPKIGWQDAAHGVGRVPMRTDYELDFSLPSGADYVYKRILTHPSNPSLAIPFTMHIDKQVVVTVVQDLGKWMDAEVNIKSVFHCYGACKKYTYPWQMAKCARETDFEYQTAWNCNPGDCPGVGTGCTACGIYLDRLRPKGTAYKIITLTFKRKVCYQLGTQKTCKTLESNDCLVGQHIKICTIGTMANIQVGDTLLFLGPLQGGALIIRQWCTGSCRFGDPGDIMTTSQGVMCPEMDGTFQRICRFATEPECQYQGNTVSGYKRLISTKDSFISLNMSSPKVTANTLEWSDPNSLYKDHMNVVVQKDLDFEVLSENSCHLEISTKSVEGSWGSGIGFTLKCTVALTECGEFMTTIKACDASMCYGGVVAHLQRGQNDVVVQGKGGHSGSNFKCCHDHNCSASGLPASPPHLERVHGDTTNESIVYSDGAPQCGVTCSFAKVGEWVTGLLRGNWIVIVVLVVIAIISIIILGLLCPARKH